jgi:putative hemolysin
MEDKFIDIEKLIGSKNPRLLKALPAFLLNYLKKTIHQEEINQILVENKNKLDYDFCHDIIDRFNITVNVHNQDNIVTEGGCIFVVNHPLGGMDAMAIVHAIQEYRTDVKFIVNDILMHLKNLNGLFVGVNKHGVNSKKSLQVVNELFASDKAVFVFPAGLVSRKKNGIVSDLTWKKTFVTRARKFDKKIIPVYLEGELTNFFYRLSNFRTAIGIKANIEMLYLAQELFKQKNKTIDIVFGEPILPNDLKDGKSDQEWADKIKETVYSLKAAKNNS